MDILHLFNRYIKARLGGAGVPGLGESGPSWLRTELCDSLGVPRGRNPNFATQFWRQGSRACGPTRRVPAVILIERLMLPKKRVAKSRSQPPAPTATSQSPHPSHPRPSAAIRGYPRLPKATRPRRSQRVAPTAAPRRSARRGQRSAPGPRAAASCGCRACCRAASCACARCSPTR